MQLRPPRSDLGVAPWTKMRQGAAGDTLYGGGAHVLVSPFGYRPRRVSPSADAAGAVRRTIQQWVAALGMCASARVRAARAAVVVAMAAAA